MNTTSRLVDLSVTEIMGTPFYLTKGYETMPLIMPKMRWRNTVMSFAQSLRSAFGTRLLRIIALPSPEDEVYESNILVVIKSATQEDVRKVMDIAVRSGENLNPLVVNEEDEEAVVKFIGSGGTEI